MKLFYPEMESDERDVLKEDLTTLSNTIYAFNQLWVQTHMLLNNQLISDPIAYGLLDALSDGLADIEKAREKVATIQKVPL